MKKWKYIKLFLSPFTVEDADKKLITDWLDGKNNDLQDFVIGNMSDRFRDALWSPIFTGIGLIEAAITNYDESVSNGNIKKVKEIKNKKEYVKLFSEFTYYVKDREDLERVRDIFSKKRKDRSIFFGYDETYSFDERLGSGFLHTMEGSKEFYLSKESKYKTILEEFNG